MIPLGHAVDDYLAMRRALGYKLIEHGRVLPQFTELLEQRGESLITIELALEFAMPQAGSVEVLAELPDRLRLGFGCLDVRCEGIETPETIADRVRTALRHVPAERLSLNPDCGFAPSGNNPIPLDEVYAKLTALARAAQQLRAELV